MILSYIYGKLNKTQKKDFAFNLAFGLVSGLVSGLVFGLVSGLVFGLAFGVIHFTPIVGIIILIIMEILFWADRKKFTKGSKIWFTIDKTLEALLETGLGIGGYVYVKYILDNISGIFGTLSDIFKVALSIVDVVGFFVILILVNSLKYVGQSNSIKKRWKEGKYANRNVRRKLK